MKRRRDIFEVIEEMLRKNMEDMHKKMENMDIDPSDLEKSMKNNPKKHKAFSIKITQGNEEDPKISIKEFGEDDPKRVNIEPKENEEWVMKKPPKKIKQYKEADTKIQEKNGMMIIEIDLPEKIKKENIEMHKLSNSLEVRAHHGKTGYYNIFPLESGYHITKDGLKKGKYKIFIQTK